MKSFLKKIWLVNLFRRISTGTSYFNKKYPQILKWAFQSNEFDNFTYEITPENERYLAFTISLITGTPYDTIYGYLEEISHDEELKQTISHASQAYKGDLPADKTIHFGRRIGWYAFVRALKPEVVIETGIDKGMGAMVLCAALLRNREEGFPGKYYGTDINPEAGYMLTGKYREMGEILYGDSIASLQKLKDPIDLFINDSDHSAEYEAREYECIAPLLHDRSVILGDNAHVTDKLSLFAMATGRNFLFFQERPKGHWYPGAGIGIAFNHPALQAAE